jgi:hypothetical protein
MCDQDTPAEFSFWIMDRVYEQTLAFIILIPLLLFKFIPISQQGLLEFIQYIIILFAGQFTVVYVLQKQNTILNDKKKMEEIFVKMMRFGLPLIFLLFLAIMIGQLFSRESIIVVNDKNMNLLDLMIAGGGVIGFILVLVFKKDWTM